MIKIEISIGEALDKLSILYIKKENINQPEKLKFIVKEISMLEESLRNFIYDKQLEKMVEINTILWKNNEKRKEKIRNCIYDEEYLELTKEESKINDLRFEVKKQINDLYESNLKEQKSY